LGALLGAEIDSDEFFKLVTIGKMITDFKAPDEGQVRFPSGFLAASPDRVGLPAGFLAASRVVYRLAVKFLGFYILV